MTSQRLHRQPCGIGFEHARRSARQIESCGHRFNGAEPAPLVEHVPLLLEALRVPFDQSNRIGVRPPRQQPWQQQFLQASGVLGVRLGSDACAPTAPQLIVEARRTVVRSLAASFESHRFQADAVFGGEAGYPAPYRRARSERPVTVPELRKLERSRSSQRCASFVIEAEQHQIRFASRRHVMRGQPRLDQLGFAQQRAELARGFLPFEPMNLLR